MIRRVRAITVVLTVLLASGSADMVFAQTARAAAPAARQIRERTTTTDTTRRTAQRTRAPRGFATYYAKVLDGRQTASGTLFDNDAMVAAHPNYPFGTLVRVTNLANGHSQRPRHRPRPRPTPAPRGRDHRSLTRRGRKAGFHGRGPRPRPARTATRASLTGGVPIAPARWGAVARPTGL